MFEEKVRLRCNLPAAQRHATGTIGIASSTRFQWYPLHASAADGKAVREFLSRPSLTAFAVVFAIVGDEAAAEDQ